MPKRILQGVVTSDKGDKSITVKVERRIAHPLYKKVITKSKKYNAHDESNSCKVGDLVSIQECKPGDIVVVSVIDAIPRGKVKKGTVHRALIVRTRKETKRADGTSIKFDTNAAVLVDKGGVPIGTRIFGPVTRELRAKGYFKILSLAPEVL